MRLDVLVSDTQVVRSIELATRLDRFLRVPGPLRFLSSWDELESRVERGSFDVVFVQPTFRSDSRSPASSFRRILRLLESLPPGSLIIISCDRRADSTILDYLRGIPFSIVLLKGIDDHPKTILRALSRAWTQRRLNWVPECRGPEEWFKARGLAMGLLAAWPPPGSVEDFAAGACVSPRTLRRKLKQQGFPSPLELIRCGRLLDAISLRRMGIRSPSRIASVLGIGDNATLKRMAMEFTGLPPEQIFEPEASQHVIQEVLGKMGL